jgi:hypothetical protein
MAATRCRVLIEYRNGEGVYQRVYHAKGKDKDHEHGFVPCRGEGDVEAMENAFIIYLREDKARIAQMRKILEEHRKPSRD